MGNKYIVMDLATEKGDTNGDEKHDQPLRCFKCLVFSNYGPKSINPLELDLAYLSTSSLRVWSCFPSPFVS